MWNVYYRTTIPRLWTTNESPWSLVSFQNPNHMKIDIQDAAFLKKKQLPEKWEHAKICRYLYLLIIIYYFMFCFQMKTFWLAAVLGLIACTDAFAVWRNSVMHKRARVRDPNWQPCLQICIYGWEVYQNFHLKYCATECIKFANVVGIGNFEPNRYCFDFSQWIF